MNSSEHRTEDQLEAEATAWVFEQEDGFSPERARAFGAWVAADRRHAEALARVRQTLGLLAELPEVSATQRQRLQPALPPAASTPAARRVIPFPVWLGAIAAVLLVGFLVWQNVGRVDPQVSHVSFVADAASPRRVTFPDGSVVNLKQGSTVRLAFTPAQRTVYLEAGEAHFEVFHDASRPFIVHAAGVAVRAVGTAFNVRVGTSAVDVLVVEGKVDVAPEAPVASAPPPARVVAGERLVVARAVEQPVVASEKVEKAEPAAIRATLAWQNPLVNFNDVPLRDVVRQFNPRNEVQLVLGDTAIGERRIGGVIAVNEVEAFVRLLERDGNVVAERRGSEIVLRSAR